MLKFLANFKRVKGIRDGSQNLPSKKNAGDHHYFGADMVISYFTLTFLKKFTKIFSVYPPPRMQVTKEG